MDNLSEDQHDRGSQDVILGLRTSVLVPLEVSRGFRSAKVITKASDEQIGAVIGRDWRLLFFQFSFFKKGGDFQDGKDEKTFVNSHH